MPVDQLRPDMESIGHYDLLEKVAEGGMGTVYKGRDRRNGQVVAVKVVPPHIASNPVYLKRFEQEYNAARALNHPNMVRAIDFGREAGTPYLVMEFVEGESLGQKLERDGRMDEAEAIRISAQVAQGLDRAHELGLVHRDVKPDNILLTPGGDVKVTDLGLVKEVDADSNLTRTGRGLGTPHFMAPEQFRNAKNADARCDIYSLAATTYMMVTGELPFDSNGPLEAWMKKVKNDIKPPAELAPELSPWVDRAIRRGMSPDPAERPASCREFIAELTGQRGRARTPADEELAATVTSLWHLLYKDAEGIVHLTRETSEGVRRAMQDGSLGDVGEIRLARQPQGPFEPPRNFPEFHRTTSAPAPVPAPAPPARRQTPRALPSPLPVDEAPDIAPPVRVRAATPVITPAGPLIDLGGQRSSYDWLAWLTLTALGVAAAVAGSVFLPGLLRGRWF